MKRYCHSLLAIFAFITVGVFCNTVCADDSQPGYLELKETTANRYSVIWRNPKLVNQQLALSLQFPAQVKNLTKPVLRKLPGATVERRLIETGAQGIIGQRIDINGLQMTNTDVLVRIEFANGASSTALLKPSQPWLIFKGPRSAGQVVWDFTVLGVEHILSGFDHLLFVLALLLIVSGTRRLLMTITAFTIAHSITLAAATLGWLWLPGPPVEATIALSILFLASEMLKVNRGQPSLTANYPWLVAFAFGLLHGLGFAGALADVGLPQHEIPLALLMFNIGVELGQILFVVVILVFVFILQKLRDNWPLWSRQVPAYGIGTMAAFWFVERVSGFYL
ncbi:HupE/UreJ family protein [Teredinibacter franksiae]|uniref:HupE/UreJ family protein n=1 Tax=Teredinibacter franksiae TaxID=2761453 RepID=UPI0016256598|nr:HupE/UreJ family protein [Teredinibacter franksiae]